MPNELWSIWIYFVSVILLIQTMQFLLMGNNRNSHCFIEHNNAAYCLSINPFNMEHWVKTAVKFSILRVVML